MAWSCIPPSRNGTIKEEDKKFINVEAAKQYVVIEDLSNTDQLKTGAIIGDGPDAEYLSHILSGGAGYQNLARSESSQQIEALLKANLGKEILFKFDIVFPNLGSFAENGNKAKFEDHFRIFLSI